MYYSVGIQDIDRHVDYIIPLQMRPGIATIIVAIVWHATMAIHARKMTCHVISLLHTYLYLSLAHG